MKNAFLRNTCNALIKRSPLICGMVGIGLMVTGTVLAVIETPKAVRDIEEKKEVMETTALTPVETVKTTWKRYLPVVLTETTGIIFLLTSNRISAKRHAALLAAYMMSETALEDYRRHVQSVVGERKEKKIREEISKDRAENYLQSGGTIIHTNGGDVACYDMVLGKMFYSSMDTLKRAVNEVNFKLRQEMYISMSEFMHEIGVPRIGSICDDIGWNIDDGPIDVSFGSILLDDTIPCISLDYRVSPRYDFRNLY